MSKENVKALLLWLENELKEATEKAKERYASGDNLSTFEYRAKAYAFHMVIERIKMLEAK